MLSVRTAEELTAIARDRRVNGILRRHPIRLELPRLAQRELIRWQRRFDRYQARCGCVAGSLALLGTLVAGVAWLILSGSEQSAWQLAVRAILLLLAAAGAAGIAKLGTLLITQVQFTHSCHRLASLLRHR